MIRLLLLSCIWLSLPLWAQIEGTLRSGIQYESNSYYSDKGAQADMAFLLEPVISYKAQLGSRYSLQADAQGLYAKYSSLTNQDFFKYDVSLNNTLALFSRWRLYVSPRAKLESEPAVSKKHKRLERQFFGAEGGVLYNKDNRRQWRLNVAYEQENLNQNLYKYLNNSEVRGTLTYRKYFLPETFAAFVLKGGTKSFPNGKKEAAFQKYNSTRIEPGFAVAGRVTRYLKIRTYAGFVYLNYEKGEGFKEPVFLVEFEEELSPKDSMIVGYDYSVEDTYHGNYLLMQKMYLGYARFLGDQILLTTKLEYLYRFFSLPYRRDDQRLFAVLNGEYSWSQKLKVEMQLSYDLSGTDSLNTLPVTVLPNPVDPSASYEAYNASVWIKYLF